VGAEDDDDPGFVGMHSARSFNTDGSGSKSGDVNRIVGHTSASTLGGMLQSLSSPLTIGPGKNLYSSGVKQHSPRLVV
jgi:hypothetical protein